MSRAALDHRVRAGRWLRLSRGVFATVTGELTVDQQLWSAILTVGPHAVLAGPTAAAQCGMRIPLDRSARRTHILLPADVRDRNPPAEIIVHRTTSLPSGDINRLGLPPHTTIARSIVDAASWAATDELAYTIVAAAFQQRRVNAAEIGDTLRRMSRVHRRSLIQQAAIDAAGGVHSLPEGLLVRGLRAGRLPMPALQVLRRVGAHTYYLDGYYEDWSIHLEVDGGQHADPSTYWQDMRRQNEIWIGGDRVLRFPSFAVRYHLPQVTAQIRAALITAGWTPP